MKPVALVLLLFSLPLFGQQPQPRREASVSFGQTMYELSGEATAGGASYNHFWTRVASTRAGVIVARQSYAGGRETNMHLLHASAEYHPFRGRLLSPRLSGGIAYAAYSSEYPFGPDESDSTVTAIAGAGIDVGITPRFVLGAEGLYLPFTLNSGDRFALQLDPVTWLASARFRW
jgi:hypothetical protein